MNKKIDIQQKVGDMSQYAGYRHITFQSGRGKGTEAFEAYNAAGLSFSVIPDKCMDIFNFSYKGNNFSYLSKNGLVGNNCFSAMDGEFLNYWSAGMLSTCGFENTGPSCMDGGNICVMHGRAQMLPAEHVCARAAWNGDDYEVSFEGEVRQSTLWGMNLRLKRKISFGLHDKEIKIEDVLENMEPNPEEFMLLYHFNFGYPLLDEGARVVKPAGRVTPKNDEANRSIHECLSMQGPSGHDAGVVFFHENSADQDGYAYAALMNDKLKLGAYLKYSAQTLPTLSQWKCTRPHDYVLGLEPGNSYMMGRVDERKNGSLQTLEGYGKVHYTVILGVMEGEQEMAEFEKRVHAL